MEKQRKSMQRKSMKKYRSSTRPPKPSSARKKTPRLSRQAAKQDLISFAYSDCETTDPSPDTSPSSFRRKNVVMQPSVPFESMKAEAASPVQLLEELIWDVQCCHCPGRTKNEILNKIALLQCMLR